MFLCYGRPKTVHQIRAPRSVLAGRRSHASDRDRTGLGICARLAHEPGVPLSLNGVLDDGTTNTVYAPSATAQRSPKEIKTRLSVRFYIEFMFNHKPC